MIHGDSNAPQSAPKSTRLAHKMDDDKKAAQSQDVVGSEKPPSKGNASQESPLLSPGLTLLNEVRYPDEDPMVARVNDDLDLWAVGYSTGVVRISPSAEDCHLSALAIHPADECQPVTDLSFCPNSKLLATYASGFLRLWMYSVDAGASLVGQVLETDDSAHGFRPSATNSILALAVSVDGQRCVTAGADCVCRVYDARSLRQVNACKAKASESSINGHKMRVCAVRYHPLGASRTEYEHVFVSAGWDDVIMIWDDRCSTALFQYFGPHVCANDALDIHPSTNFILAGSWSRDKELVSVFLFNHTVVATSNTNRAELQVDRPIYQMGHKAVCPPAMAYVAKWLDADTILVAGGNSNVLCVVSKAKMTLNASIQQLPGAVFSVAVSSGRMRRKERGRRSKVKEYRLAVCSANSLLFVRMEGKTARGGTA